MAEKFEFEAAKKGDFSKQMRLCKRSNRSDVESYSNKTVLVIGLGISGCSVVQYLLSKGAHVLAVDDHLERVRNSEEVKDLVQKGLQLIEPAKEAFPRCIDYTIVSPGIPRSHPFYLQAQNRGSVIGEMEFALSQLQSSNYFWIGITGTNGKTTVTLQVEHLLQEAGIPALAIGNVGLPLTTLLIDPDRLPPGGVVIVELSSFQLETVHHRYFDAGILLNITEDHLDRYDSFEDYADAKFRLIGCCKDHGICYVEESCLKLRKGDFDTFGFDNASTLYSDGVHIFHKGVKKAEWPKKLQGKMDHDMKNALASYAMVQAVTSNEFMQGFESFQKPPHRMEWVANLDGISFINDSKATNIDATLKAVESLEGSLILIAGGVHKGASYKPWKEAFKNKIKSLCLIGESAGLINEDLEGKYPTYHLDSLREAVERAVCLAKPGDTVLLSPGCASFDMFSDYTDRGNQFKKIVLESKERCHESS